MRRLEPGIVLPVWAPAQTVVSTPDPVRLIRPDGSDRQIYPFEDSGNLLIRLMATEAGAHRLETSERVIEFEAIAAEAMSMVTTRGRHFVWADSGEAFPWNATTAYLLAGLEESLAIKTIDRLADHGITRIRVALNGSRQLSGARWNEPQVTERADFTFCASPFATDSPADALQPGYQRGFHLAYWQKFERLVDHARIRGIVVQVIFLMDAQEPQNDPFHASRPGNDPEFERRYYELGVDRLAAFANVEWCLSNEWALYRSDDSVREAARWVQARDPYGHLLSVHGHGHFPFADEAWCTHATYQVWDEHGGADWVRAIRADFERRGIDKPIVNDEFGYEDHYTVEWGERRQPPARDAESRARLAWEIQMAGGYATTGESAASGHGGWINGLGSKSELMDRHRHLSSFLGAFDRTRAVPHPATGRALALAIPGEAYAVSLMGGSTVITLPEGRWDVDAFDSASGVWEPQVRDEVLLRDRYCGPGWVSPHLPYGDARGYLIRRRD